MDSLENEIYAIIQHTAMVKCRDCIAEKTPLYPYVGKIKVVTPTSDGKGVLFTIRCDFPDLIDDTHTQNELNEVLNEIIEQDSIHMIVLQRR